MGRGGVSGGDRRLAKVGLGERTEDGTVWIQEEKGVCVLGSATGAKIAAVEMTFLWKC